MADWLTKQQAAEFLEIKVEELEKLPVAYAKRGPLVRYDKAVLEKFIDEQFDPNNNPDNSEGWEIVDPSAQSAETNVFTETSGARMNLFDAHGRPADTSLKSDVKFGRGTVKVDAGGYLIEIPDGSNDPAYGAGVSGFEDERVGAILAAGNSRGTNESPIKNVTQVVPGDNSLEGLPQSVLDGRAISKSLGGS